MADIKCGRCDRYYSKFRSRCPYCGTLKINKGKKAVSRTNSTWTVVAGVTILAVLIAAVLAVLYMTYSQKPNADDAEAGQEASGSPIDSGGVVSDSGEEANAGNGTDAPAANALHSLTVSYGDSPRTDITMKEYENVKLSYRSDPADFEGTAVWSSSDESIVSVMQSGEITAVGAGTASVYVALGDRTAECVVRVKAR